LKREPASSGEAGFKGGPVVAPAPAAPAPASRPLELAQPEPAAPPAATAPQAPSQFAEGKDLEEGERIKTAAELGSAHELPPLDASTPSLRPSADAEASPSIQAESDGAPWMDEWKGLKGPSELTALHSFILRYRERRLAAHPQNTEELEKFVREATENNAPTQDRIPETAPAKQQVAILVDRELTEDDQRAWAETRERGTAAALRAYVLSFPKGRYVSTAEQRLAEIEERAFGRKKDAAAWGKAERTGTPAGFEAYLKAYPNGRYREDARKKLASLATARSTAQKEDAAWQKANKQRTRGAYSGYLATYPKGRYAANAQETLDRSEAPAPPQASPPRSIPDAARVRQSSGSRFPSSDEPFIDRLQGSAR
jgi:hypothetical protein